MTLDSVIRSISKNAAAFDKARSIQWATPSDLTFSGRGRLPVTKCPRSRRMGITTSIGCSPRSSLEPTSTSIGSTWARAYAGMPTTSTWPAGVMFCRVRDASVENEGSRQGQMHWLASFSGDVLHICPANQRRMRNDAEFCRGFDV